MPRGGGQLRCAEAVGHVGELVAALPRLVPLTPHEPEHGVGTQRGGETGLAAERARARGRGAASRTPKSARARGEAAARGARRPRTPPPHAPPPTAAPPG